MGRVSKPEARIESLDDDRQSHTHRSNDRFAPEDYCCEHIFCFVDNIVEQKSERMIFSTIHVDIH